MFYIPFCLICSNHTQRFLIRYSQRCRSFKTAKQNKHVPQATPCTQNCYIAALHMLMHTVKIIQWANDINLPSLHSELFVYDIVFKVSTQKREGRGCRAELRWSFNAPVWRQSHDHGRFEEEDEEGKQNDVTPYRWYPWYWYINLNDCTRLRLAFENLKYCVTLSQRDIFFTLRENKQIAHKQMFFVVVLPPKI